jgi:tRNA threonylcarbamoyladenosine biosynthesis protein TsaB
MNTLAFDTCFGACSVAVTWRASDPSAAPSGVSRFELIERGHAERLMPMVNEAMGEAPFSFSELQRIIVTTGPGTFTGQRVGIAAARALSLATGAPVATLSSLAVMAHAAAAQLGDDVRGRTLAIAVDARRGEVYFQAFAFEGDGTSLLRPIDGPALLTSADAALTLAGAETFVAGSGAVLIAAAAGEGQRIHVRLETLQPDVRFLPHDAALPTAARPRPLYLRPPDAKPQGGAHLNPGGAQAMRVS